MRMALSNPQAQFGSSDSGRRVAFCITALQVYPLSNGGGLGAGGLRSRCATEKTGMGARWLGQGPQEPPLS